jgi:hypothetical protein
LLELGLTLVGRKRDCAIFERVGDEALITGAASVDQGLFRQCVLSPLAEAPGRFEVTEEQ